VAALRTTHFEITSLNECKGGAGAGAALGVAATQEFADIGQRTLQAGLLMMQVENTRTSYHLELQTAKKWLPYVVEV
jgi:hypothetical protein